MKAENSKWSNTPCPWGFYLKIILSSKQSSELIPIYNPAVKWHLWRNRLRRSSNLPRDTQLASGGLHPVTDTSQTLLKKHAGQCVRTMALIRCVQGTLATLWRGIQQCLVLLPTSSRQSLLCPQHTVSAHWVSKITHECRKVENEGVDSIYKNWFSHGNKCKAVPEESPPYWPPESPLSFSRADCKACLSQISLVTGPKMIQYTFRFLAAKAHQWDS